MQKVFTDFTLFSDMLRRFWNLTNQYDIKLVLVLSSSSILLTESSKPEMSHTS